MLGRPVVVDAGPETGIGTVYRAREFQSERELRDAMKRPDLDVGPPPRAKAVAGRMNATGIAVFYGATDPDVALAEKRPPVGSKVLIGCFAIIRPLKLLDLASLDDLADEEGSLFDGEHRQRLKRAQFLRGLSRRLSKPVMPNDAPLDYLPTQAIADFLATAEYPPLPLDGIIYPSVQTGEPGLMFDRSTRRNVALFHRAAQVEAMDEGAAIEIFDDSYLSRLFPGVDTMMDDSPEVKYTVWVTNAEPASEADGPAALPQDDPTLRFMSLTVCYVRAIKFDKVCSSIERYPAKRIVENGPQADGSLIK